ncbi:hypothetical protein MJO28_011097 [Puccinia striiformis f. sp. tritici]|uniref:Uncharacterized protein n=1 Tax=Puccinia striiformis f. sp. tritici TaxID=168172 RepID=A0ACC0E2S6_9BASI|nr:hypothetical protein MJO28_011097 [Puccinia striiformis f. sp. tritici]
MVVQQERPSNAHGSEIGEASSPESRDHEYCEVPSVRIICLRAYRSTSSGRELAHYDLLYNQSKDDIFAALGNTHAGDIPGWPSTTTVSAPARAHAVDSCFLVIEKIQPNRQIHQYGLKMVSSGPVVRIRLLLVQLGLWMVCNGSENPARRVTLNLFPGGDMDDIDNMVQLSLAPPQTTHLKVDQPDDSTISMQNPSTPFEDGMNAPRVFSNQHASIAPGSLNIAAGAGCSQMDQSLSTGAGQAHRPFAAQDSLCGPTPAAHSWSFTLLPAGVEDENGKASPTLEHQQHFNTDGPTWSGAEENKTLELETDPSKQSRTGTKMTASSSLQWLDKISHRLSPTPDAHVQYQPAKRIKYEHHEPAHTGVQESTIRNEAHLPQTGVPDTSLSTINQLKKGISVGTPSGCNPLNWPRQNFMNSGRFSDGPSTSFKPAIETEPQKVTLKTTDLFKFNANFFQQDRRKSLKFHSSPPIMEILEIIERSSPSHNQLQHPESHLELVHMMIDNFDQGGRAGDWTKKHRRKTFAWLELCRNRSLWFKSWKERTAGIEWPEWPEVTPGRGNDDQIDQTENQLALLMLYIDVIGTIFRGYYPIDLDSIADPSSILLKQAVKMVKPSIEDKSFLLHEFFFEVPRRRFDIEPDAFLMTWDWLSVLIMESGHKNLKTLFFRNGKHISLEIRALFDEIFCSSIQRLNSRLKYYDYKHSTQLQQT